MPLPTNLREELKRRASKVQKKLHKKIGYVAKPWDIDVNKPFELRIKGVQQPIVVSSDTARVWGGGLQMAKYLEAIGLKGELSGKRILELGGGSGLGGLVAACFAKEVIVTDLDEVLPEIEDNLKRNRACFAQECKARAMALPWGQPIEEQHLSLVRSVDLFIGSDLIFNQGVARLLSKTLSLLARECGQVPGASGRKGTFRMLFVYGVNRVGVKEFVASLEEGESPQFSVEPIDVLAAGAQFAVPSVRAIRVLPT